MLTINSTVGLGHRAIFPTRVPPKGTCSRILSLRLHRRSRVSCAYDDRLSQCQNIPGLSRSVATATPSSHAVSDREFLLFRDLAARARLKSQTENGHGLGHAEAEPSNPGFSETAETQGTTESTKDAPEHLSNPFRRALRALQQRDTRRLFVHLQQVTRLGQAELHELSATLPRTTFTEFFRSLDPLGVARDVDPTERSLITVGVYQALDMESFIDEWGIRHIYLRLLRTLLVLVGALKASGQPLLAEEYIYLLRCAGAASDPAGAKMLWDEMLQSPTAEWRHNELFSEFVSARFLTRPLYTGHDKTRRMVMPRNLHRSRFYLQYRRVYALDRLRLNIRLRKLRFGLNKDQPYAEDLMRMMRKINSPKRLVRVVMWDAYRMTEPLLCALMVGFGRSGSLRFAGSVILNNYFGIRMPQMVYSRDKPAPEALAAGVGIERGPYRIRPTFRLMQAIVETYGCNGEIAIAFQLVDHISKTYHIPIPPSVWLDLLEWTYIMSCPPASTAWKLAAMPSKVPSGSSIDAIWNTMISAPYHVRPGFAHYNVIISSLLGRHRFGPALPLMRQALHFYNIQCQEYEQGVLEYVQMIRDGLYISDTICSYERARTKKSAMHYDIRRWCRTFLSNVRSFDTANPLAVVAVPDFIQEFRPFIPNPARYRTATGYVSLVDPAQERPVIVTERYAPPVIPVKKKKKWAFQTAKSHRTRVLSSNSLAGNQSISKLELLTLLTSTSRLPEPRDMKISSSKEESVKERSESATESSYDDDDYADDDYI
ncbi:hypothetical protein GGR52DRAFT_195840 [Hypoxylon sp. FL1284]|nr:hypothetical protein GGR52DRAFT_195840 [Hypoxylon sp. FL1284]